MEPLPMKGSLESELLKTQNNFFSSTYIYGGGIRGAFMGAESSRFTIYLKSNP